jgi:hypothetical protein
VNKLASETRPASSIEKMRRRQSLQGVGLGQTYISPKDYKKFVVVEGFKKFPQKSATCLLATSSSLSPLVVSHLLVLQMSYDLRKYRSKMAQEEYKTSQFSSDYNLNLF